MNYKVVLSSAELGMEEFEYDNAEEMRAGYKRLREQADARENEDGIEREVFMKINN